MIRSILYIAALLVLLLHCPCFALQISFPPEPGPYTGDYVLIDEPGRYTLEGNISHSYPVGVIIRSSSVILDGQGYTIMPKESGEPSVGIWVTLLDTEEAPVTGVRIMNCSIEDEVSGIYLEGVDSSAYPWGRDHSADEKSKDAVASDREISLSRVSVSGCRTGISSYDISSPEISAADLRRNERGITIDGGSPDIQENVITENKDIGISLSQTTGGEITGCRIEGNQGAGIALENCSELTIWNNILDNPVNIRDSTGSDTTLYHELINQTNIIQGDISGGNLWAHGGIPVYDAEKIPDADQDGIGDIPYTEAGHEDRYPLIPQGTGYSPEEIPVIPNNTPTIVPAPVSTPFTILTGIHAVITSDTIPPVMKTGTTYPVSITLLNDGTDDWLDIHAIGIKASEDATTFGPEWIAVPGVINSKQSYTFNFDLKAPSTPGTFELAYQAIRSGQGVSVTFGRPYKKVITVE